MRRVTLEKIGSATYRLGLARRGLVGDVIPAEAGAVVAARVTSAKTTYDTLEDVHGRLMRLRPGDVLAGVLGHRDALHGYSGVVPQAVAPGDTLQLLNRGGVIGRALPAPPGVEPPFELEVLGAVLEFPEVGRRVGRPASIRRAALVPPPLLAGQALPPVVAVLGTSMNSGKTTAACALVHELSRSGLSVAAGKLTGVSLRSDILQMADSGADPVALFTDFGVVTTNAATAASSARALVSHLVHGGAVTPDVLVLELGDGIFGTYGVDAILSDERVRGAFTHTVLCASDPVGAWGARRALQERYGLAVDVVSGPITNSHAGLAFCARELGLPTWNALRDACPLRLGRAPEPVLALGAEVPS